MESSKEAASSQAGAAPESILFDTAKFEEQIKQVIELTHKQMSTTPSLQAKMEEHLPVEFVVKFARQFSTNLCSHFYAELAKYFFEYLDKIYGQQSQSI